MDKNIDSVLRITMHDLPGDESEKEINRNT